MSALEFDVSGHSEFLCEKLNSVATDPFQEDHANCKAADF